MRILKLADVERKIGQRKSWIYDMVKLGRFPAPVKLAGKREQRASGWIEDEIDAYIARAIKERDDDLCRSRRHAEPAMADA